MGDRRFNDNTGVATNMQDVNAILDRLSQIEALLQESRLGFHAHTQRTPVYCNRSKGGVWYTLDIKNDMNPIPIESDRLLCYLEGIVIKATTRKKKGECEKFRLYVQGDRPYVLEAGWSTAPKEQSFAKGIVWAIAHMSQEQLKRPVDLQPQPGTEDGVLFCRLFQRGKSLYFDRPTNGEPNWDKVLEQAIANLEKATGRSFREKPEDAHQDEASEEIEQEPVRALEALEAQATGELPFMDMVNQGIARLESLAHARDFYGWMTERSVWQQISAIPAAAELTKKRFEQAIARFVPEDISDVKVAIDAEIMRLKWSHEQFEYKLVEWYNVSTRSRLSGAQLYLLLWRMERQNAHKAF